MINMIIMLATMMASSKYMIRTGCIDDSVNDYCGDDDDDDDNDDDDDDYDDKDDDDKDDDDEDDDDDDKNDDIFKVCDERQMYL